MIFIRDRIYVIQELGGNKNSPDSLNAMENYHYHGENRVITIYCMDKKSDHKVGIYCNLIGLTDQSGYSICLLYGC